MSRQASRQVPVGWAGTLLHFWRAIPETKCRSLQQLEQDLTGWAVG
jgi:hypothetical protein